MQKRKRLLFDVLFEASIVICLLLCICPAKTALRVGVEEDDGSMSSLQLYTEPYEVAEERDTEAQEYTINLTYDPLKYKELGCTTTGKKLYIDVMYGNLRAKRLSAEDLTTYDTVYTEYPENEYFEYMQIEDLLDKYVGKGYIIALAVSGDGGSGLTQEAINMFHEIGCVITPADYIHHSYYLLIDDSTICVEKIEMDEIDYETSIDGHQIYLRSRGNYNGADAEILIDGINYCTAGRGINAVVYNTEDDTLIDSVVFDTSGSSVMTRNYDYFYSESEYVLNMNLFERISSIVWVYKRIRVITLLTAAAILLIVWINTRKALFGKNRKEESARGIVIKQIPIALLTLLAVGLVAGYQYLCKSFKDVSISQLLYHLNTDLGGTNWGDYVKLIAGLIALMGAAVLLNIYTAKDILHLQNAGLKLREKRIRGFRRRAVLVAVSTMCILGVFVQFYTQYGVLDYFVSQIQTSTLFEQYYVDAAETDIVFPENKKNLIYIFVESMEITNATQEEGGAESFNAIPELVELAQLNDCFNGTEEQLNGGLTQGNTTWTVAGMLAQTAGIPLNAPTVGNDYGATEFLPGAYSIGEILEQEGYSNCLLLGSEAKFAHRATYFKEHGNYEICDYDWAIEEELIPQDYRVWWGYEDAKLFEFAKDKIIEMSEGDEPFNFTMLTADTHFTDGYWCQDCEELYDAQYSNVLACASHKIGEFIEWIQEQDFYEDTVIVISGDHLCMDAVYYSNVPEDYERKTYVNVINSAKSEPNEVRQYTTMDLFPTTLSAMGCEIEGNRLGLGTDLYSDTQTLTEFLGKENYEYQLGLTSEYYKNHILIKETDIDE